MNYVVGEKDREPYRIEGDDGPRTVRVYTEEGLNNDKIDYTFLVAYIAPYGSNSRHEHTVDELMYVASGHGSTSVGDNEEPLEPGSVIHAPTGMMHQVFNDSPETMKLVCTFLPKLPKDELDVLLDRTGE